MTQAAKAVAGMHNLEVVGSNPAPATNKKPQPPLGLWLFKFMGSIIWTYDADPPRRRRGGDASRTVLFKTSSMSLKRSFESTRAKGPSESCPRSFYNRLGNCQLWQSPNFVFLAGLSPDSTVIANLHGHRKFFDNHARYEILKAWKGRKRNYVFKSTDNFYFW